MKVYLTIILYLIDSKLQYIIFTMVRYYIVTQLHTFVNTI